MILKLLSSSVTAADIVDVEIGLGDAGAEIEAVVGGGGLRRDGGERQRTERGDSSELHVHERPLQSFRTMD